METMDSESEGGKRPVGNSDAQFFHTNVFETVTCGTTVEQFVERGSVEVEVLDRKTRMEKPYVTFDVRFVSQPWL